MTRQTTQKFLNLKIPFVNPNAPYTSLEGSAKEDQCNKMILLKAHRDAAITQQARENAAKY